MTEEHEGIFRDYRAKRIIGLAVFLAFASVYFLWSVAGDLNDNINTMDDEVLYEQLTDVSHISDKRAREIIENRPYQSWDDVEELRGIGKEIRDQLEERFTLIGGRK